MKKNSILFSLLLLTSVIGCATHQHGYDTPVVTITSFEAVPSSGVLPQFKIGLHIVNPNRSPLELKGIAYTIALEGHNIMTGVSNKLPLIEPYSKGDVVLTASVDVFNSFGFLNDLIRNQKRQALTYSFKAKLDTGTLYPLIRVEKSGILSLKDSSNE